jgi:hypothetical protein
VPSQKLAKKTKNQPLMDGFQSYLNKILSDFDAVLNKNYSEIIELAYNISQNTLARACKF